MPTYATPAAMTCQVRDKTDEYIQDLGSPDPHVRQAACQGLGRDGQRPRAVPPLLTGLQDQNNYVRLAAAMSLGQAAKKGDDGVLEALIARLGDPDASVRRVACTAVQQVANKSQAIRARSALLPRCEDKDGGVRRSAVKALEKVAEKDDGQVLNALLARSNDTEAFVRFSSVEALSNVAIEGNVQVLDRMLELVSDRDSRVRCCTCEALGRLAARGDSRVLTALLSCLEDEADAVRRAAATSLGQVTFAPLQELELQERHIAELEFREQHEVSTRDRTIADLKEKHEKETAELRARVYALEDRLKVEVEKRDAQLTQLKQQMEEQEWIAGVGSVIPHAGEISKFVAKLPELAGAENYGKQITAPIWALRSMRVCQETGDTVTNENSLEAKEKRSMLSLFELFERVSCGTTPWDLTEASPLDCFVHRLEDGTWGLFCSSHQRLLAFIMRQACNRNELMRVKCVLRSKEDLGYWSWHWNCFYDGADGRTMSPKAASPQSSPSRRKMGFSCSSPRLAAGSPVSTPRGIHSLRGVRPRPKSPGEIQSSAALAAATSALGASACVRSPRAFGQAKTPTSPSVRRSKSSSNTSGLERGPSSPRQSMTGR